MNHANQILAHIAASREAEKNVSPAPWNISWGESENGGEFYAFGPKHSQSMSSDPDEDDDAPMAAKIDAAFIASARTDLPKCWEALEVAVKALAEIASSEVSADEAHACNHPTDAEEALSKVNSILVRS